MHLSIYQTSYCRDPYCIRQSQCQSVSLSLNHCVDSAVASVQKYATAAYATLVLLYRTHNVDWDLKMQFCMQSEGSTPKKAHVVPFRMVFLMELRGAFFQSARAESCTFPLLTISSPFEPGLPRPASQPASQPEFCMHDRSTDHKIQWIFVHAVWLASGRNGQIFRP